MIRSGKRKSQEPLRERQEDKCGRAGRMEEDKGDDSVQGSDVGSGNEKSGQQRGRGSLEKPQGLKLLTI